MLAAVYSDSSSLPKYLLGVSQQMPVNSSAGWQTVPLIDKISVKNGETVWLAVLFENSTNIRSESGTPGRAASAQTWASGMPTDFGSSTTASTKYSI